MKENASYTKKRDEHNIRRISAELYETKHGLEKCYKRSRGDLVKAKILNQKEFELLDFTMSDVPKAQKREVKRVTVSIKSS